MMASRPRTLRREPLRNNERRSEQRVLSTGLGAPRLHDDLPAGTADQRNGGSAAARIPTSVPEAKEIDLDTAQLLAVVTCGPQPLGDQK